MGEGLEASDTIVKESNDVDLEYKMLNDERVATNNALLSSVKSALAHFAQSQRKV